MNSRPRLPPRQRILRGAACLVIGLAVLLAPALLPPSPWRNAAAASPWVGWVAVAVGAALMAWGLAARRR